MTILISDVKAYLRIDHTEDDAMLGDLLDAATEHIESLCMDLTPVPAPVEMATKILCAHFYDNRLPSGTRYTAELPFSVSALISPYRNWEGTDD
jgi:uncharacterized phage protein (predicted DNA packaging)